MTSEPLEMRVSAIFDYWDVYLGGEKLKTKDLQDTPEQMSLPINDPILVNLRKLVWNQSDQILTLFAF